MKVEISGKISKFITEIIVARDYAEAIKKFQSAYPESKIEFVDNNEIIGICETTGFPIYEWSDYSEDEDGIMWLNK